jgi:hypothetical protein
MGFFFGLLSFLFTVPRVVYYQLRLLNGSTWPRGMPLEALAASGARVFDLKF